MTNYSELRLTAEQLCRDAADLIVSRRAELGDVRAFTQTKSSAVDPVTVVDTATEEFIAEALHERRPDDGLIGEEGSAHVSRSGVTWIVDPIDGTVNFLYGLPAYAVSIAAAIDGAVVAGAVINVASRERYSAARGEGATVLKDGKRTELRCNQVTELSQALLATGFGYAASRRAAQAELIAQLLPRVRDIRRLGSAALDLCMVAEGRVDAHMEHGLNSWDFAAGSLIAEEAGALTSLPALSTPGDNGEIMVAAAPGIWDEFQAVLRDIGAPQSLPR